MSYDSRPAHLAVAFFVLAAFAPVSAPAQQRRYTPADVEFMQGMIGHHAQAIAMAALVPGRTTNPSMQLLAQRIDISQRDEIRLMQNWLQDHGQAVPDSTGHTHHGGGSPDMLMPGMLTANQMTQLAAAKDTTFDRLFLQFMIQHHQGALAMVKTLFESPGAAQATDTFRYVSGVDSDQRAEIERMQKMLDATPGSHQS
jgi:uncharacterized protein (DUF305 family)